MMSNVRQTEVASVVSLWRYPVKSMMGEELNAADVTERGLLGDRAYALVDPSNGKVVSAKNPRKWAKLFDFRAVFVEPPRPGAKMPPIRITLPSGTMITKSVHTRLGHSGGTFCAFLGSDLLDRCGDRRFIVEV